MYMYIVCMYVAVRYLYTCACTYIVGIRQLSAVLRPFLYLVLQVIVPVSLYVTIEIVRFVQVYFINWDVDMYYEAGDRPFQCRALNISEDLGQIEYVFSDKTGTLTENDMVFRCCSIGGKNYPHTQTGVCVCVCVCVCVYVCWIIG